MIAPNRGRSHMRPILKSPIRNVYLIVVCVYISYIFWNVICIMKMTAIGNLGLVYVLYMLQKFIFYDLGKIPSNLISKVVID